MVAKVQKLYDDLFSIESRINKGLYPIHKKLKLKQDIYDIVIQKLEIISGAALDAGCGVGYGTQKLAKSIDGIVTGITISEKEYKRACELNIYPHKCNYSKMGFEDIDEKFDYIICIESLKHTLDINQTLNVISKALVSGGKLIVVDDFFTGLHDRTTEQFMKDWELNFLITEEHLNSRFILSERIDLSPDMYIKNKFYIKLLLAMYSLSWNKESNVTKLFRGGNYLDKLYNENKMKYLFNIYTKK